MNDRRFTSDSILDRRPSLSDTAAANALVPVPGNELGAAHVLDHLPDGVIEGEFKSDWSQWENVKSGFYCRRCKMPLLVGDRECPGCRWEFDLPTPPRWLLKSHTVAAWCRGRYTQEEIDRLSKPAKKKPWLF